jgi:hypothetical protein
MTRNSSRRREFTIILRFITKLLQLKNIYKKKLTLLRVRYMKGDLPHLLKYSTQSVSSVRNQY